VVVNTSSSPATLTELADDSIGDLDGQGDCTVGGTIEAGATYACSYTTTVSGNAGDRALRTVTALLTDEVDATTAIASGGGGRPAQIDALHTGTFSEILHPDHPFAAFIEEGG
jgi:hypothetical protein